MLISEQRDEAGDGTADKHTQEAPYHAYRQTLDNPLLPIMIENALKDGIIENVLEGSSDTSDHQTICFPNYANKSLNSLSETCSESISVLDLFPKGSSSKRDAKSKLRVKSEYLTAPQKSDQDASIATECFKDVLHAAMKHKAMKENKGERRPKLMVLYDQNAFIRRAILT